MQGELVGTGSVEGSRSDDMTWWYRVAVRGVGVCAGISSAIAGLWNCITIYPLHLVSGIWMILAAFVLFLCEAPFCCQFLEFANKVSAQADKFKYWQKGALYCLLAIVPVIINPGLTSVLGNFITFATGVLYGLTILGKKGDGISYANIQHRQEITMMDVSNPSVP